MNEVNRLMVIPPLESGDRMTREEFERRYETMPHVKKAELIDGVVYMPSPVSADYHGEQHFELTGWLAVYVAATPGLRGADNSTVRLDMESEPQPDTAIYIVPESGGQVKKSPEGYVVGGPDMTVEVAASSVSIDLGLKRNLYLRNSVREYLVWRVYDNEFDWFILRNGQYDRLTPDDAGVIRSEIFPGLWLDVPALLRRDLATVLSTLQRGLAAPEHAAFVQLLRERRIQL